MIPRKIHCCWFREPKTPLAERCLGSWRRFAPDFEIVEHAAAGDDFGLVPAFWSDRERFRALYEQGGVYFDCDVELVAPMDGLCEREWCAGEWLPDGSVRVNPGSGIALAPHSPIAKAMLEHYDRHGFDNRTTVGEILARVLATMPGALEVLPPEVFSPIDCRGRLHRTAATRGIHHYAMSWTPWWRRALRWFSWHGGRPVVSALLRLRRPFAVAVAIAVSWCALVELAEAVAAREFGMVLDGDWFLLAVGSSVSAMGEFLSLYAVPLALALAAWLAITVAAFLVALRAPRRIALAGLAVFAGYVVWNCRTPSEAKAWKPLYVAFDTVRGAHRYAAIVRAGEWTEERAASVRPPPADATNVVFVIGESMTTDRLPFFGYAKDTMPLVGARTNELAVTGPYRAWSPYTVNALAAMFIRDGESAAVRYRRAGYRTAFVTAHNRWTRYCSVEFSVFAACEERIYLTEERPGEHIYDDMVLEHVARLVAGSRPFVLFVHLMGSHFSAAERVRPEYLADSGLDDFDRSLRFTDEVLDAIIRLLPPKTMLVYLPDHGESTDAGRWRDFSSRALWSVPLIVYPKDAALPDGFNLPPLMEDVK